jgi:hypothetical protein
VLSSPTFSSTSNVVGLPAFQACMYAPGEQAHLSATSGISSAVLLTDGLATIAGSNVPVLYTVPVSRQHIPSMLHNDLLTLVHSCATRRLRPP